jgi:dihydroanticapsin dehydrogenase
MRFRDKVALVTGGTSGIGLATAELFLREGASVVITGRRKDQGRAAEARLKEVNDRITYVVGDVSRPPDARSMVEAAAEAFGGLDVLFNNAGIFYEKAVPETTEAEWEATLGVNLTGTFLCSKYAIPHMRKAGRGAIVNNASVDGLAGEPRSAAYCASKGGVVLLTKAMALDHAREGIRVNCVCAGWVDTAMLQAWLDLQSDREEALRRVAKGHPIPRVGRPEDIARAVLFLASDEASWITGVALPVDGGCTASYYAVGAGEG